MGDSKVVSIKEFNHNGEHVGNYIGEDLHDPPKKSKSWVWLLIGFLIFVVVIIIVIVIIAVIFTDKTTSNNPFSTAGNTCENDGECDGTQKCISNICTRKKCRSATDCNYQASNNPEACINGFCEIIGQKCDINNPSGCPSGTFCSSNGICVQCLVNDNNPSSPTGCNMGAYCNSGGVCINNCTENSLCNGNAICVGSPDHPSSRFCCPSKDVDKFCGIKCTSSDQCQNSTNCKFCVNGFCTCVQGGANNINPDICTQNTDCNTNNCKALRNVNVCQFASPAVCFASGPVPNGNMVEANVYCTDPKNNWCNGNTGSSGLGKCSNSVFGVPCGPDFICSKETTNKNDMAKFCINGLCDNTLGLYGDLCYQEEGGQNPCNTGLKCLSGICQ